MRDVDKANVYEGYTTVLSQPRPFFMKFKSLLIEEAVVTRTLTRLSYEIVEKADSLQNVVLVGIRTRGVPLCDLINDNIYNNCGVRLPVGELDITLYRDDLSKIADQPVLNNTHIDFSIDGKDVVLVDDVLYTGRTVRAAIDALFSLGRPATIKLAVLVDRGHRELPIRADFVGKNIPTSKRENVAVHCVAVDGVCNVELYEQ